MEKDYWKWHSLKARLEQENRQFIFNTAEIWLSALGLNLGREEDGKGDVFLRPIIIFRKINNDTFWAIPLTSQEKIGNYYYGFNFGGRPSVAMLSQIRLLDRKRLWRKTGVMEQTQFFAMAEMFRALLPQTETPPREGFLKGRSQSQSESL